MSNTWNMAQLARYVLSDNGSISLSPDVAGASTTVYETINSLPLTGNESGEQAFVSENNRLYIWSGTGWYNIALVNTSPTAITGADGSYAFATDGTPIEITLVSTDPEGIPITWSYAVTSGSLTNGGGTTATVSQAANVFTITPSTNEDYVGSFGLTFTASDGVNLATATSSFTLQFRILNSKYTTLMLKAESSGSNTTFVDSSPNNFTITRNGDVTQGTFGPYSRPEGAWSNYFDGSGDYLQIPYSTSTTQWWLQDFTIEMWVYNNTNSVSGTDGLCLQLTHGVATMNTTYWSFGTNATGKVEFYYYNGGGVRLTSAASVPLSSWNHISMVYTNSTGNITLYLNGTSVASGTKSGTPQSSGSSALNLGVAQNTYYNGYISNARVIQGTALYTSNFTPPTDPLTAIAGTSLLTCQSNRFVDNSTNNFAITRNGDVKVTAFGPHDQTAYDSAVNGGSAYFDGSGDRLVLATSTGLDLTGDFTIEMWANLSSLPSYSMLFDTSESGTVGSTMTELWVAPTGAVGYYVRGFQLLTTATGTITTNTWYHIALVKSGTSQVLYINGVSKASATSSTQPNTGYSWHIGDRPIGAGNGQYPLTGYISNFRVVNGTAVYTANFTPPTEPITAIANTSLLLNFTNAGIYDSAMMNNLETVGNAQISTSVTKYGTGSMSFDGTGDYLSFPISENFVFNGDFTIEMWAYVTLASSTYHSAIGNYTSASTTNWQIEIQNTGVIRFYYNGSSSPIVSSSGVITNETWQHIAAVRSGSTVALYVDGTQIGTASFSGAVGNLTSKVLVASVPVNTNQELVGYIEDLRITKGLARYTANFTPPTSELMG